MTNEVSNKTLAALLVVAVVVSLGGSLLALNKINAIGPTARAATTSGTTSLNIQSQVIVNVTQTSVDFGNVTVYGGTYDDYCTLDSVAGGVGTCNATATDGTSADGSFVFENIGNVNINVSVKAGASATSFIGSTSAEYNWKCRSKTSTGTAVISAWTASSTSDVNCYSAMPYSVSGTPQEAYLDIQLKVPADATPGQKTDTITFSASQA